MKSLLLLCLLWPVINGFSQPGSVYIDFILSSEIRYIPRYEIEGLKANQVYLEIPFAKANIINPEAFEKAGEAAITKVELVYTTFRESDNFTQRKLNRERLTELFKLSPDVLKNSAIQWELIGQTNVTSSDEGKQTFHGFIVTFRPTPTLASVEKEIKYLTILKEALEAEEALRKKLLSPENIIARYDIKTRWNDKSGYYRDTIVHYDTIQPVFQVTKSKAKISKMIYDSTVLKTFARNKDWKDMLVITDVTGSMALYTSQVIAWYKYTFVENKVKRFAFFNDGNGKKDGTKIMGSTGGIYEIGASGFDDVYKTMEKTMRKGGGGDAPENDVEAILKSTKNCEDCGDIILVADNRSNMRDFDLIRDIKKPVKIILCGTEFGMNIEYLELARATGGSIHTFDEDITNLKDLQEGEQITLAKIVYKIQNGRFIPVFKI